MYRIKQILTFLYYRISKKYYVFGDSHTEVFEYMSKMRMIPFKYFYVNKIGGATAQGMRNPNSRTNAMEIFLEEIQKLNKKSKLIFLIGEVDTGFVIWYRANKYNENIQIQLNQSVEHYFQFIDNVISLGYKKIIIMSAPLPTIEDNQNWGEVANARKDIKASKRERTVLTLEYNALIKEKSFERNLVFLNTDDYLLDTKTNVIKEKFKNKDPNNHHLDVVQYSRIVKIKFACERL